MNWDGEWVNWHGLDIPSQYVHILEESLKTPQQNATGWLWYGPTGSGKTRLAEEWLTQYGCGIQSLNWKERIWRVDCATVFTWDSFLIHLDNWLTRLWTGCENLHRNHWILIDGSENLSVQRQWDLIQRFRKHTTCGVIWCVSSIQNWIDPLKQGCHVWNWYDLTQKYPHFWEERCIKNNKPIYPPWNYHSWKWIPIVETDISLNTLESDFHSSLEILIRRPFKEWVEIGSRSKLFSIPWEDLVDLFRTKVQLFQQKKERTAYLTWCIRGIELQPLFSGLESIWHQWNQWGWEGIHVFKIQQFKFLPKSNVTKHTQPDARTWLQKKWETTKDIIPITNLFLWGPPGGGKTTFVEYWMKKWFGPVIEPRCVYYRNASEDKWMSMFKDELVPFIESSQSQRCHPRSRQVNFKWIVLDEIDQMATDAQEFLRGQMDKIVLQKLPIYVCIIANERCRVLQRLQYRFQTFYWAPPSATWLKDHFKIKIPRVKKIRVERGIPLWWIQYGGLNIHSLGCPSRFWQEEAGDLRRIIFRQQINSKCLRSTHINSLRSRGDLQFDFWNRYAGEDLSAEFWSIWDKSPIMSNFMWDSCKLYSFWEKISDFPPNATWVYLNGDHPEKKLLTLSSSFVEQKYQIEQFTIWNEQKTPTWVRNELREYSRKSATNGRKIWILKNPDDLPEEAQVCLRRLIDDTVGRIIWWFVITRPHCWMNPLRSRAPLLLLNPNVTFIKLEQDESYKYRSRFVCDDK